MADIKKAGRSALGCLAFMAASALCLVALGAAIGCAIGVARAVSGMF